MISSDDEWEDVSSDDEWEDVSSDDEWEDDSDSEDLDSESGNQAKSISFQECIFNIHRGHCDDDIQAALGRNKRAFEISTGEEVSGCDVEGRKIRDMGNLRSQLKDLTRRFTLREVRSDFNIDISNSERVVSHDHSLNIFWEKFAIALAQLGTFDIQFFAITKVELPTQVVKQLAIALRQKNVTFLKLINNRMSPAGLQEVARLIECTPSLITVELSHNRIDDLATAEIISAAFKLQTSRRLQTIKLAHCSIGNNLDILFTVLRSGAMNIDLRHNDIGSPGIRAIAEYLESNPELSELWIDYNRLNDDDAIILSQSLKKNTKLRNLTARSTTLSVAGVQSLFESVFNSSNLNTIAQSNHTCTLSLFAFSCDIREHMEELNSHSSSDNRKRKISLALQDRESLLHDIADVPVQLMPDVLALIFAGTSSETESETQSETGSKANSDGHEKELLNLIYPIFRWWNMPALYSYNKLSFVKG